MNFDELLPGDFLIWTSTMNECHIILTNPAPCGYEKHQSRVQFMTLRNDGRVDNFDIPVSKITLWTVIRNGIVLVQGKNLKQKPEI